LTSGGLGDMLDASIGALGEAGHHPRKYDSLRSYSARG
jgi:hypothetical protein